MFFSMLLGANKLILFWWVNSEWFCKRRVLGCLREWIQAYDQSLLFPISNFLNGWTCGSWSSTDHPMRSHSYQVGVHWSCPSRDFQWHNSICWKGLVSIKGGVDVVIPCLWCRLYYDMFSLDKFLEWTMNNFTLLAVVLLRALPMVSKHSSM